MTVRGNFCPIIFSSFSKGEERKQNNDHPELQCDVTKLTQGSSYTEPVLQRTTQGSAFILSHFLKGHNQALSEAGQFLNQFFSPPGCLNSQIDSPISFLGHNQCAEFHNPK